jgi:hypothetical protein
MAKNQSSSGKKSPKSGADSRINRKREKAKSFERYDRQRPVQLTFFEILEPENKQYSNTVEIYDFCRRSFRARLRGLPALTCRVLNVISSVAA